MKRLLLTPLLLLLLLPAAIGQTTSAHVISSIPFTPCVGSPVTFTAMDTTGNYQNSDHYWSFGDGSNGYGNSNNPSTGHTYSVPGTYSVGFWAYDSISSMYDSSYTMITIDSICSNHDNFSGNTYHDANGNGNQDVGEPNWPNRMIEILPGPYYFTSDQNGNWSVNMTPGTWTFTAIPPVYHATTEPSGGSYTVTSGGTGASNPGNNFGFQAINGINDLNIHWSATPPVPGFTRTYYLHYANVGTTVQNATITFDYDPSQTFVSVQNGGTQSGNTCTWNIPNVFPGTWGNVTCQLQTPVGTVVGTTVAFTATINPIPGDTTPGDNVDARDVAVLGSYDPNDKAALPAGVGVNGDISPNTRLTYTIRFQNTGNFPATFVILRDTLDTDLDESTLEVVGGSHPFTWHNDFGKLTFDFQGINLPDSNSNEPGSHGHVVYRISHKAGLPLGTQLTNTAFIYFDFNPPVVTNTTLNTLANLVGVNPGLNRAGLRVAPNPFGSQTQFLFDNPSGAVHSLMVRDASGRLVKVETGITGSSFLLDGSGFAAGMYLYTLQGPDGVVATGKMVKE
jgi:hypothetical protein